MRTLALDLGTHTGWAVSPVESGTWDFTPRRFDGGGMRFLRFRMRIQEMFKSDIRRVAFEEVRRHLGVDAAHVYGGFMAVLTEVCENHKIPYEGVPVGTIKRHATGKGNADKEAMVKAAIDKWGDRTKIVDDNHADALWLLDHVESAHA